MAKPTIDVNQPQDSDIIGEGAEKIRETRRAIYDLFPIGPDDLDYEDTSNWWPAGSLTGGFDPAVERGDADPHPDMQDRYALVGQQVAVWDWPMPDNKNILTIGLDTGTAIIETPDSTNWVNIETDDKVQPMRLHDLMDVYLGTVEPEDDDVLVYNDTISQWVNRPRSSLAEDGADGAEGKGWTGTTVLQDDADTYIIRFDSAYPELVFDTVNLKGPAGNDGTSAYQEWLDAGNTGTEQDFLDSFNGTDGVDGDSAYQIWLDAGNSGTEQDFLDSLVGPQGDGIRILGHVTDSSQLPASGNVGDAYLDDNGHLWIWENSSWVDAGQVQGPQGDVGPSITLVPGTATKLDHQAAPTVTLSDLGNDTYQYDFGIPAGEPADPLDLEPLENAVADLQTDVGNLEGRVGQNELDISGIQAEQITQNNAIQANQDKNAEQDLRLDDLESDVADNAAAIEVNANAIIDIQNIQGGANTVPDPVKADDVLMSDAPGVYSWRTVDFDSINDVRDKVYDHENQIHGNPDTLPDPTPGLIDRVTDLEGRVDSISGTDPDDHVTQDELNTALYGAGSSPSTADDGVYASIQANTDLIEEINTVTIPALDGRVTQNEADIAALQTSTGDNASAITDLEARVTTNEGDIAQNTGDIQQNQTDIANNAGNIATNTSDITAIKTQLTPGSHETILTSVDNGDGTFSTTWAPNEHIDDELPDTSTANEGDILALVDNNGTLEPEWIVQPEAMDLGNTDPWTHGQYNELYAPTITNDGTVGARVTLDLHVQNNVHLKPIAGSTCSVFIGNQPTNFTGMYAHITLDKNSRYEFDETKFNMGTTIYDDLDNDLHLSFLAEDSIWHCVGMSYVGADLVAGGGSDAYSADGSASIGAVNVDASDNLQFNSGYGSTATAYGCRAWVNFDGTGTVAIRASGNVSSITDRGTGQYAVNFSSAMPDANYVASFNGVAQGTSLGVLSTQINDTGNTSGSLLLRCGSNDTTPFDPSHAHVAVFR